MGRGDRRGGHRRRAARWSAGDRRIGEDLAKLANGNRAFLLANHGAVTLGRSLRDASDNYEELEETAKLIFTLGDRRIRYLSEEQLAELRR